MSDKKVEKEDKKNKKDDRQLRTKVKDLKKETENWKEKYLRALADYQNLEKRVRKELLDFKKRANQELILRLLDIFDSLEKAEVFIKDEGLKLVRAKFNQILIEAGVEEIEVLNKKFDPNLAECVEVVRGKKDNQVVEVLQKGYKLNDQVIRVARVKVEKKYGKNNRY